MKTSNEIVKVVIHKIINKTSREVTFAIKHPSEYTYTVMTTDGLLEYSQNEMEEQYTFLNKSIDTNINDLLKKAFIGA